MSTPILPFANWSSGTNQNSIPANDNALRLQIINGEVISQAVTAQPGSPVAGDIYIIAATHTGAQWALFDPKDLAIFSGGTWYAFAPVEGVVVNVAGTLYKYDAGVWAAVGGGGGTVAGSNMQVQYNNSGAFGAEAGFEYDAATNTLTAGVVSATGNVTAGGDMTATGKIFNTESIIIAASDEATAITTGTGKVTFRMPYAFTLSAVRAGVSTAPTGATIIIDINEAGASILSTKLSIDATEKTSTTAASAAVISDGALADDAEITIDFDQVGSTIAGAGVKVCLIGKKA